MALDVSLGGFVVEEPGDEGQRDGELDAQDRVDFADEAAPDGGVVEFEAFDLGVFAIAGASVVSWNEEGGLKCLDVSIDFMLLFS